MAANEEEQMVWEPRSMTRELFVIIISSMLCFKENLQVQSHSHHAISQNKDFISLGSTHKKIRHYLRPSCPNDNRDIF
ncbi:hypothetical protein TorRG33x02_351280 [Trema orientale]|uniref:Uncharacterized protein n=1 Tax=Trema orientale TaxID=63057 RepID=A0A2P5AG11_TREOI|nr:hypothetical protein TorRG33x02_351280 [Trema orientale]